MTYHKSLRLFFCAHREGEVPPELAQPPCTPATSLQPGGPCRDCCRSSGSRAARWPLAGIVCPRPPAYLLCQPERASFRDVLCRLWDTRDTQRPLCAIFSIKWPTILLVCHRKIASFHRAACGCSFVTVSARRQIWCGV